jgi:hypothetical protein
MMQQTKDQRIKVLEMQIADLQLRVVRLEQAASMAYVAPCICAEHHRGESTAGWNCPRHGTQL